MQEGMIGFTLGELGLLVAFVLIFAIGLERREPIERTANNPTPEQLATERAAREESQRLNRELRDSIGGLRDSIQTLAGPPPCARLGIVEGYLLRVVVIGSDGFVLEGDTLSLDGIRGRFASQLQAAAEVGCVHQALAVPATSLPVDTWLLAFNRLGGFFYVRGQGQF